MSRKKITVVITLPSSTMNITGFLTWARGSSFGNESRTAVTTSSREKRLEDLRATVECEVELQDVHAGLAEEVERAAFGVLLDQLLHGRERQVSDGCDPPRLQRR